MRDVVSAVEIVIDEHLPVASHRVHAALEEMQSRKFKRRHPRTSPPRKSSERRSMRIEIDEDELLPRRALNGDQPVLRAIETAHAFKLRCALQRAVESVAPAVIGTTKNRRIARSFCDHGRRMMPANVVKSAQLAVGRAHDDQWLACKLRRDKLSGPLQLVNSRHHLPRSAEDVLPLEFARSAHPHTMARVWCEPLQRALIVVGMQDFAQRQSIGPPQDARGRP